MKKTMLILALVVSGVLVQAAEDVATKFAKPPAEARPWVFYFLLSGNLTKEGITADFEAMARVGIGGVICMDVDQGVPRGKADFADPLWMDLFRHACKEANRLGIEVNMNNDAGWCGSGGPWIKPELSMQKVVWKETTVEGGQQWNVALPQPEAVRGYYQDIAILAMPAPEGNERVQNGGNKALFQPGHIPPLPATFREIAKTAVIERDKIVDLTGKTSWKVPPGKWLVIRFGHTSTGKDNHPAPESGRGLECDKFNREAIAVHYRNFIAKLVADNKALTGKGKVLMSTHVDSWEIGSQNWTPKMVDEFKARRGYDLRPFLPAYMGYFIDSEEVTERFLWDLRKTVSDLIVENYAGELRRLANQDGLQLSIEGYSWDNNVPVDESAYAGQADLPIAEFWAWPCGGFPRVYTANSCPGMTSAAHTYGRRIIGAEAFTSADTEKWQSHPGNIKILGDWAFCEGINRLVFHRYAAQPWTKNVVPGMAMGPWGLHYERTQTWWEQSRPWHDYISRCQYLLQQGLFVADACYLQPEGSPRRFDMPPSVQVATDIRGGYNFDGCSPDVVLTRMKVANGRIVLPDGMNYRVLVLPDVQTMTLGLLRKIKQLADAGAVIVAGPKPPQKSPSLADFGTGDAEVKRLAAELWPKLVTGKSVAQLLGERGVPPDFRATTNLRYIHRTIGSAEVYFVANPEPRRVDAVASFRVAGKSPELWQPETGRIETIRAFTEADGCTHVPLALEPAGSVFVVFTNRKTTDAERIVAVKCGDQELVRVKPDKAAAPTQEPSIDPVSLKTFRNGNYEIQTANGATKRVQVAGLPEPAEITGPWEVLFAPGRGAPDKVTMEKLVSWSEHGDEGIKHFSGSAVYRKKFTHSASSPNNLPGKARVHLDLGKVAVMAEVKLNGKDLGVLWKTPYRVEVTDAIKTGENTLEIKVVNLWVNRLIADESLPEDSERNGDGSLKQWPQWLEQGKPSPSGRFTFTTWKLWKKDSPLAESGLLGPVVLQTGVRLEEGK